MNTSLEMLTAYVSPASIGGRSLYAPDAVINAESIESFSSHRTVRRTAVGKLVDMGLKVEVISSVSVRVTGPARIFQKTFGIKFERKTSSMYTPTDATKQNCLNLGSEVFDGIAFPQPLELHGTKRKRPPRRSVASMAEAALSTTAPVLPYFHLRVPDDIVQAMNAGPVHAQGNRGDGIKVAMIDSGFHWSHPYFQNKGYDLSVELPAGNDDDDRGHGTGESANLLAVAPKAKLYGLSMADTIQAFAMCRNQLGAQIISNSWGTAFATDGQFGTWDPYWSQVLAEIALCRASGIIVMFSGGNGQLSFTASSPDTISVGGVYKDENGALSASNYASSFSSFRFQNHSQPKEVHVPEVCGLCGTKPKAIYIALPVPKGCEIDKSLGGGTFPNGDTTTKNDGWAVFSGTSAACPMVAGVVALMLKKYPDISITDVRARLYKATDVTTGSSFHNQQAGPGYDFATGYGLVDAVKALA